MEGVTLGQSCADKALAIAHTYMHLKNWEEFHTVRAKLANAVPTSGVANLLACTSMKFQTENFHPGM